MIIRHELAKILLPSKAVKSDSITVILVQITDPKSDNKTWQKHIKNTTSFKSGQKWLKNASLVKTLQKENEYKIGRELLFHWTEKDRDGNEFFRKQIFDKVKMCDVTKVKICGQNIQTTSWGSISPTFYAQLLRKQIPKVSQWQFKSWVILRFCDLRA